MSGRHHPHEGSETGALGSRGAGGLVFLASGAVLVLEILSLRLVAPYVGLSLQTNTAVIGVALAAIAAGAWAGGHASDAFGAARLLGPLMLVGGFLMLLVAPLAHWAGPALRGGGAGAVVVLTAVAIFPPAAILSAVAPVVAKLRLTTLERAGTVVGSLSGVGTLGAITATFATGFVLVAMAPTTAILFALGVTLVAVGVGLTNRLRRARGATAPIALVLLCGAAVAASPQPCDVETAYHCARVVTDPHRPDGRILELDNVTQSYVDLADPAYLRYSYVRAIALAVDSVFPPGASVRALHIGAGGLTVPRYLAATRPGSNSLVLEIDAGVLAIDERKLGTKPTAGVTTRVQDARLGVAAEPAGGRDVVIGDAFGSRAVPWHLVTREMVAEVRRVLRAGGIYAQNVIDMSSQALVRAVVATTAAVFRHVAIVARAGAFSGRSVSGNYVVLASERSLPVDRLRGLFAQRSPELTVGPSAAEFSAGARVLTDDFAPVDQLLNA